MKSIRNKTHRPLKVHLSRGKILHLGPGKEGQVSTQDMERPGVVRMLSEGAIEVVGEGGGYGTSGEADNLRADKQGHHPNVTVKKRGER